MITEAQVMSYLGDIKKILELNSIPFWLEDGTLLGAVRDGRMIPWDHDMDLGSFEKSFKSEKLKKKLSGEFRARGFSVFFFPNSVALYKENFHIDIILLKKSKNNRDFLVERYLSQNRVSHLLVKIHKLSKSSFYGKPRLKKIAGIRDLIKSNFFYLIHILPSFVRNTIYKVAKILFSKYEQTNHYALMISNKHFKKLKKIKYGGYLVNIPDFVEEYLERKYGEWKQPPKDPSKWKWYEVGEWPKIQRKLNREKMESL